ncbi:MAG: hypothetical protein WBD67_02935 [Terracidiphilus sp.]
MRPILFQPGSLLVRPFAAKAAAVFAQYGCMGLRKAFGAEIVDAHG